MVFFHSLSNLPLDQPLFLGVHMRFWMQPNIVLFCFVPIGLHECLAAGKLWRPLVVVPFVVLTAAALVGVNFKSMDQSSNYYVIEFGRALLESRKQGSIILTQGDMVTNSIRYLQRCEKVIFLPTPFTLHPTPYNLHPTPYDLHPTPFTLHPTHCTLHPTPYNLAPCSLDTSHLEI
jgi:hypothetical protein